MRLTKCLTFVALLVSSEVGCLGRSGLVEKPFSQMVFNALPYFEELADEHPKDLVRVQNVGRVIEKHGLEADVGVTILHKHFPLSNGEMLQARRHNNSLVVQAAIEDPKARPYLYQFVDSRDTLALQPLEFVASADVDAALLAKHNKILANADFLADSKQALNESGLLATHGLRLLSHQHSLGEGSTFEQADRSMSRTLLVTRSADTIPNSQSQVERLVTYVFRSGFIEQGNCKHCGHCRLCR